jgi:hypothetical protein
MLRRRLGSHFDKLTVCKKSESSRPPTGVVCATSLCVDHENIRRKDRFVEGLTDPRPHASITLTMLILSTILPHQTFHSRPVSC